MATAAGGLMTSLPSGVRVIPEDITGYTLCAWEASDRAIGGGVAKADILPATRGSPDGGTMKYDPVW